MNFYNITYKKYSLVLVRCHATNVQVIGIKDCIIRFDKNIYNQQLSIKINK
jgi:hypothetical protein